VGGSQTPNHQNHHPHYRTPLKGGLLPTHHPQSPHNHPPPPPQTSAPKRVKTYKTGNESLIAGVCRQTTGSRLGLCRVPGCWLCRVVVRVGHAAGHVCSCLVCGQGFVVLVLPMLRVCGFRVRVGFGWYVNGPGAVAGSVWVVGLVVVSGSGLLVLLLVRSLRLVLVVGLWFRALSLSHWHE
jgi:hypothetical protein